MTDWISRLMAGLLVLSLVWAPATHAEDIEQPGRIIAIGDLHGDYEAWRTIAERAGVIDARGRWAGGDSVLVQMGDVTDRGPDSLRIIRHLQKLQARAQRKDGRVIVLLGNHEAMNVIGDLRYVDPGEYAAFEDRNSERRREAIWQANQQKIEEAYALLDPPVGPEEAKKRWFAATPLGMIEHRIAWQPGGELAQWAASLPAVVQIGDYLFVHGGLSAERAIEPIEALNARHSAALQPGELVDRSVLEDPLGVLWYRGNIMREVPKPAQQQDELLPEGVAEGQEGDKSALQQVPEPEEPQRLPPDEELTQVLAQYGAKRLIVAHTPSITGIVTARDDRLIRIDTGISSYYGGPATFLEITGQRIRAYRRDEKGIWHARELPELPQRIAP